MVESRSEGTVGGVLTVRRVLLVEGAANFLVLLLKLAVGIASGSAAVFGDALHSITDLSNNVFAWLAIRVADHPPDAEHPYGHRKFESLAVFTLAVLLCVVAVELAGRALLRADTPVTSSPVQLGLMLGVLAVNILLSSLEMWAARRLDSDILAADAGHTASDVATTVVVIIGWQAGAAGYPLVDSLFALGVAAIVAWLAWRLFQKAIPRLVDEAAADPAHVERMVEALPDVQEVRRVRTRVGGAGEAAADIIVAVDGSLTTDQAHDIADAIEKALAEQLSIGDVTVHIEPGGK